MSRISVEEISRGLGISEEELLKKGLVAYLEKELRLAEQDIAKLKERYKASSPEQLEEFIASGKIYSHPAWEDLIIWENTLHHTEKMKKLLKGIQIEVA